MKILTKISGFDILKSNLKTNYGSYVCVCARNKFEYLGYSKKESYGDFPKIGQTMRI